jgi:NitT/TauT family transport system permease protein
MKPQTSRYWLGARGWVVPLMLLVLAEVAMRLTQTQSEALAMPSEVAAAFAETAVNGSLLHASLQTLGAGFGGLMIGCGLGLLVGIWFGLSRLSARLGGLTVQLLMPIPSVALIPLSMMIFGFGYRMEILVVAFTCFFPMLLLTRAAVANVEPRLLEVSKVLGLSMLQQCGKIILPAASPRIFTAFRLVVGIALVVSITVEIAANPYGLGYAMMLAQQNLQPAHMLAFLFWIGLLGWAMNGLLLWLQKFLFVSTTQLGS